MKLHCIEHGEDYLTVTSEPEGVRVSTYYSANQQEAETTILATHEQWSAFILEEAMRLGHLPMDHNPEGE